MVIVINYINTHTHTHIYTSQECSFQAWSGKVVDFSEGDEKALFKLVIQAKNASCKAKVAVGCCQSIHGCLKPIKQWRPRNWSQDNTVEEIKTSFWMISDARLV